MPEIMMEKEHDKQIEHIMRLLFGKHKTLIEPIDSLDRLIGLKFIFYFQFDTSAFSGTIVGAEKFYEENDEVGDKQGGICLKIYVSNPEAVNEKIICIMWHWELECWAVWFEGDEFPIKEKHNGIFTLIGI